MSIFMTRVIREAIEKGKNANKNNNAGEKNCNC